MGKHQAGCRPLGSFSRGGHSGVILYLRDNLSIDACEPKYFTHDAHEQAYRIQSINAFVCTNKTAPQQGKRRIPSLNHAHPLHISHASLFSILPVNKISKRPGYQRSQDDLQAKTFCA